MPKLKLNQCEQCLKTYNLNDVNSTEKLCSTCNDKVRAEIRKKDALRKALNRGDEISSNLERLSGIEDV